MGEHIHLFRVAGEQQTERVLQAVAGRGRAVEVVNVSRWLSARRPGEQHRNARSFRIVRELRQSIDPLGEHRIEAVNEQEDLAASRRPQRELRVQRLNERFVAIEIFFVAHDIIDIRIAGRRRRPFDLARLVVWRDRNCELGVARGRRSVTIEKRARPVVALARRCDEQGVVDGAGRAVGHGAEKPGLRPRSAGDEGERDKHKRQNGKRPFQRPAAP